MERHMHQALDRVRAKIVTMGGRVEELMKSALEALFERDEGLAIEVMGGDREVDRLEREIDDDCRTFLALHEPKAIDLRFVVAAMKIVTDLERMGDCAGNIAKEAMDLIAEPPVEPYIDLPRLGDLAADMVRRSLDAFVERDAEAARRVWASDDEVDGVYRQLFRELVASMVGDPKVISRALRLLLIARNLERIADHATNIAEDVIYYVEAEDIRHTATRYEAKAQE